MFLISVIFSVFIKGPWPLKGPFRDPYGPLKGSLGPLKRPWAPLGPQKAPGPRKGPLKGLD